MGKGGVSHFVTLFCIWTQSRKIAAYPLTKMLKNCLYDVTFGDTPSDIKLLRATQ